MSAATSTGMTFRDATPSDASDVVVLMDIASRGFIVEFWQTLCTGNQSALELGRSRILERCELPSFIDHWELALDDGRVAGAWAGYAVPEPFFAVDIDELPSPYVPLLELEAIAEGSFHLMALAVFPESRGRGIGRELVARAERKAAECGCGTVSIIADSGNDGACRLYERLGYAIRARREIVSFDAAAGDGMWCLFQRQP